MTPQNRAAVVSNGPGQRGGDCECAESGVDVPVRPGIGDTGSELTGGDGGLEDWFARAASGRMPDDDDLQVGGPLGAATLTPRDVVRERSRRPVRSLLWRGWAGARPGARAGAPGLVVFAGIVLAVVVAVIVSWWVGSTLTVAPRPAVVTDPNTPTRPVGGAVDRGGVDAASRERSSVPRRRATEQVERRRAIRRRNHAGRSRRATRRLPAARRPVVIIARVLRLRAVHGAAAPSVRARIVRSKTPHPGSQTPTCGPFDLC